MVDFFITPHKIALMRLMKQFMYKKIIGNILFIPIIIIGISMLFSSKNNPFGMKSYTVLTGSMEPTIRTGSVIFTRPQGIYKIGDIISFRRNGQIFTHRINNILNNGTKTSYVTKGDANISVDENSVGVEEVIGRVFFVIPYLGYLVNFTRTLPGLILLIIIPALMIIFSEIKNIIVEMRKLSEKNASLDLQWQKINAILIFFIFWLLVFTNAPKVLAYLSSLVIFPDNTITTAFFEGIPTTTPTSTSTPTPTIAPTQTLHVVINEVYYDVGDRQFEGIKEKETDNEWVELYNPTDAAKSIKGWKITDNSGTKKLLTDSNFSIGPKCFAIISKVINTFNYWTIPNKCSNGENVLILAINTSIGDGLANTGDRVILIDENDNEVDKMSYGNDTSVYNPSAKGGINGHSLERDPDGKNNNLGSDFVDRDFPTPGE